jgi:hypothetical protein
MSDSYERIQNRASKEFLMLRARLLLEQEIFVGEVKAAPKGDWLHVLCAMGDKGLTHGPTGDVQWNGLLSAVKRDISDQGKRQADHFARHLDKLQRTVTENLRDEFRALQEQLTDIQKVLAEKTPRSSSTRKA